MRQIRVSMVLKLTLSIAAASDFVWSNFTAWLMGCTVCVLSFMEVLLSKVMAALSGAREPRYLVNVAGIG